MRTPRSPDGDVSGKPLGGRELKALREKAGLTQKQVADLLDKDPATVSRWERGFPVPEGQRLRLREIYSGDGYGVCNHRLSPPAAERMPAIAAGLPKSVRVWLHGFLLELAEADVPQERIESAQRALTSPENFTFFVGDRSPADYTESEILKGLRPLAIAITGALRERGFNAMKIKRDSGRPFQPGGTAGKLASGE